MECESISTTFLSKDPVLKILFISCSKSRPISHFSNVSALGDDWCSGREEERKVGGSENVLLWLGRRWFEICRGAPSCGKLFRFQCEAGIPYACVPHNMKQAPILASMI